ncbi:hypothetical protein ISS37_01290 [candidate division KSB1 bacterium]|nr:hypothetical protein [candidate division KSB1 bacterium]
MKKKTKMKYSWFDTSGESREEWESLCPTNEYRIVEPGRLPDIITESLKQKYDSVLVLASGSQSYNGTIYYMANGNRVDYMEKAIDQQPFGLAFVGTTAHPSGVLIHHGDWDKRTVKPPEEFWDHIKSGSIGQVYPISELPENRSGSIDDLKISSQKDAFNILVNKIRQSS